MPTMSRNYVLKNYVSAKESIAFSVVTTVSRTKPKKEVRVSSTPKIYLKG